MPSNETSDKTVIVTVKPLPAIAAVMGGAGLAKLAALNFEKKMFASWGYPSWARPAVGAVEVGIAATAIAGLRDPAARKVAAAGTLATMAGAVATHAIANDPKYSYVPPALITAAAVAAFLGV
jgi:hypothetical protein